MSHAQPLLEISAAIDPMPAHMPASHEDTAVESTDRFNTLLPRVVAQVVDDDEAAQEALQTGGFLQIGRAHV